MSRPADEDLRAPRRAPDLEHERLDVLADAVVLDRRLLGRGEDRLHALADVEDDRPRLDPVHLAGDHLALAAGELVEDHVALGLAQALEDDLLGRLGVDPAEVARIELLGLDEVADVGVRLVDLAPRRAVNSVSGSSTSSTTVRARKARILPVSAIDPDVDVLDARPSGARRPGSPLRSSG